MVHKYFLPMKLQNIQKAIKKMAPCGEPDNSVSGTVLCIVELTFDFYFLVFLVLTFTF